MKVEPYQTILYQKAVKRDRKEQNAFGNPGAFYLKSQVADVEELFSNLKFSISNAFSCGTQPPNENALFGNPKDQTIRIDP